MRSYVDEHGITCWVYDEYTHPKGLYFKKEEPKKQVEATVQVVMSGEEVRQEDIKIIKKKSKK